MNQLPNVYDTKETLTIEESEGNTCAHFWMIDSPSGPTSKGVCKMCGDEKDFKNSFHITSWEGAHYRRG